MSDVFGAITGWIVFVGGVSLVVQGFWKSTKARKLSDATTATIALGLGLMVMIAPSVVYPDLVAADREPFLWTSAALVGVAMIFAVLARRSAHSS